MQGQASLRELTRSGLYDFAQKSLRELTRATRFAYAVSYMLAHVKIPLPGKKTLLIWKLQHLHKLLKGVADVIFCSWW